MQFAARSEVLEVRQLLAAVFFDSNAVGDSSKSVEEWGVDTAWPSEDNVRWSVENIGVFLFLPNAVWMFLWCFSTSTKDSPA